MICIIYSIICKKSCTNAASYAKSYTLKYSKQYVWVFMNVHKYALICTNMHEYTTINEVSMIYINIMFKTKLQVFLQRVLYDMQNKMHNMLKNKKYNMPIE